LFAASNIRNREAKISERALFEDCKSEEVEKWTNEYHNICPAVPKYQQIQYQWLARIVYAAVQEEGNELVQKVHAIRGFAIAQVTDPFLVRYI